MKMMLPDVIGHENQSQHCPGYRCLCLGLSGRITMHAGRIFIPHWSIALIRRCQKDEVADSSYQRLLLGYHKELFFSSLFIFSPTHSIINECHCGNCNNDD